MTLTPLRFRPVAGRLLLTNEVGEYGLFDDGIVERLFAKALSREERQRLSDLSIIIDEGDDWRIASLMRQARSRYGTQRSRLSYLIVVPTLRCDLACSYCQVSRAALSASGFDWTDAHLTQFERFLDTIESNRLKLESKVASRQFVPISSRA